MSSSDDGYLFEHYVGNNYCAEQILRPWTAFCNAKHDLIRLGSEVNTQREIFDGMEVDSINDNDASETRVPSVATSSRIGCVTTSSLHDGVRRSGALKQRSTNRLPSWKRKMLLEMKKKEKRLRRAKE